MLAQEARNMSNIPTRINLAVQTTRKANDGHLKSRPLCWRSEQKNSSNEIEETK